MAEHEQTVKMPTERQGEVYDFIGSYTESHGYSPSMEDIAQHFGFVRNSSLGHLKALQRKGWIDWEHYKGRTIRITRVVQKLT